MAQETEEKKKQRQLGGAGDGREEEVKTIKRRKWWKRRRSGGTWVAPVMEERRKQKHQDGPSEGREEEAGMSHPYTCSSDDQASVFLAAIEQVPNFWLKGGKTPFSPCQGEKMPWVFVSLVLTGPFWISEISKASEDGFVSSLSP